MIACCSASVISVYHALNSYFCAHLVLKFAELYALSQDRRSTQSSYSNCCIIVSFNSAPEDTVLPDFSQNLVNMQELINKNTTCLQKDMAVDF